MFDIGAQELLVIVVVAILVIGPKDMPAALRTAGRWIGKVRRVSNHFRAGMETMIREAEMEEMEKKWQEQNRRVMEQHPEAELNAANGGGADMVPLAPREEAAPGDAATTDTAHTDTAHTDTAPASAEARAAETPVALPTTPAPDAAPAPMPTPAPGDQDKS
ncbi:MAG TPA: Sec-independent protein translocase protein TatB [Sphingomonadaceae bacterium]|nr:Sec-independent protein translocase protein TatB [Sphingomonadaceae bacterium]